MYTWGTLGVLHVAVALLEIMYFGGNTLASYPGSIIAGAEIEPGSRSTRARYISRLSFIC